MIGPTAIPRRTAAQFVGYCYPIAFLAGLAFLYVGQTEYGQLSLIAAALIFASYNKFVADADAYEIQKEFNQLEARVEDLEDRSDE